MLSRKRGCYQNCHLLEDYISRESHQSLPSVAIRFGEVSILQAGSGHELYWIGLRSNCQVNFETLLKEITRGWPVERVQLDWSRLGFGDFTWLGLVA